MCALCNGHVLVKQLSWNMCWSSRSPTTTQRRWPRECELLGFFMCVCVWVGGWVGGPSVHVVLRRLLELAQANNNAEEVAT